MVDGTARTTPDGCGQLENERFKSIETRNCKPCATSEAGNVGTEMRNIGVPSNDLAVSL